MYTPSDINMMELRIGEMVPFEREVSFEEPSFTSTSTELKIVKEVNEEGINFAGQWMITFLYYEHLSEQGANIEPLTDRKQQEVLFRINLKGKISGIIKEREGADTLMCRLENHPV